MDSRQRTVIFKAKMMTVVIGNVAVLVSNRQVPIPIDHPEVAISQKRSARNPSDDIVVTKRTNLARTATRDELGFERRYTLLVPTNELCLMTRMRTSSKIKFKMVDFRRQV